MRRLLVPLLVLLAFCVVGEAFARRWIVAPFSSRLDRRFGYVQSAGARVVHSREGWGSDRVNSDGFVGHEFVRDPHGPVALLMGDSFTQGLQVRDGERYSDVAERRVPGLEILNVAQAGQSPIHYALYLPRFEAAVPPGIVIVQVDDADLSEMEGEAANRITYDIFYSRGAPAAHELAPPGLAGLARSVGRRSALVSELRNRILQLTKQERERLATKFGLLHRDM